MRLLITIVSIYFSFTFLSGEKLYIVNSPNPVEIQEHSVKPVKDLNELYSSKKLGSFVSNGKTYFRLFAPNASEVILVTFKSPEEESGNEYKLKQDENGVWEIALDGELYGMFYGFKVRHINKTDNDVICVDPYAKAVASKNSYLSPRRAIVVKEDDYDWEGDDWIKRDWRDLIIYEMHVRDITAHSSSGIKNAGTYLGLTEKNKPGGISYIKKLGVNTVELLPTQEFGNIEIPFKDSLNGKFNTWNPYERNHWGYMSAAFFAPESYYSSDGVNVKQNQWSGKSAIQIKEFKDMVKAFHNEGIAVMMDVVYNHLSEYELGNLKEIDKEYYFRLDEKGNFISQSYTGNDLKTERPMVRRLILESVLYWMKNYHIDGFRFDLGKLIDWVTLEEVIREAKKINPSVIFVCEPWGGGYDPKGFSLRGWGSWNDQIRNGIKGENPVNGLGWIFGKFYGNNNPDRIKSYVTGTLIKDKFGLFQKTEHSVNYLESHDGYTLGDFIRIATRRVQPDEIINDLEINAKLTDLELKLNKLAAVFLFTSQGITMISEGQEYARSKVISANNLVPDPNKGKLDHNSYDKDNETNYLNYNHANLNKELLDYYKGLIKLRSTYSAFRRADYSNISFMNFPSNDFATGFSVLNEDDYFLVLMNANPAIEQKINLPEGKWSVLVNEEKAGIKELAKVKNEIVLKPSTGIVLKKTK